jgi:hypothetical protein
MKAEPLAPPSCRPMPKVRIKGKLQSRSLSELTIVITHLYANLGPTLHRRA